MSNLALETLLAGAYGGQGGSGGSGGGSGTTNYNDLSNRPKINGITLSGDKSASDLGIAEYDDTALDARVTAVETALTGKADTSDIPDVSGKANTSDLAAVATSGAYNDLTGTPTIPEAAEIATAAKAGLVKPGSGLNITSDGTLVVTTPVDGNTKTAATYTVEYDANTHSLIRRKLADDGNGYDADFTAQTIELPDWSGEIATAKASLESEVGAVANAGAKNLCSNSYEKAVKSYNGMTFTRNDDGSVTANGTASADAYYHLMPTGSKLAAGKYILSGCPSGGATSKYRIAIAREASGDKARIDYNDFGSSVELTAESDDTFISYIFVRSGNTLNNLVFYPLLRDASITDDTYVPYGKTNAQITQELSDTGWITPNATDYPNLKYRRKNGYVTVTQYGVVGSVDAQKTKTLFTLPEGFRPSVRIDSTAHLAGGTKDCACQFIAQPTGDVNVWANTEIASGVSVCGSICFPV